MSRNSSMHGTVRSADGVSVAFTSSGTGDPALVFVHGGLANRTFWHNQIPHLSLRYRIVTVDLAGHGESGGNRVDWSIPRFGEDVQAVVAHLALDRLVLFGNSLGGPVALEAAARLPGRVLGVVGVDTFHDATETIDETSARARADAFAADPAGSCRAMVAQLFHPGRHPEVLAWAEAEMLRTPPEVTVPMLASFGGYDLPGAFRRAGVPIRAINGDLWPTDIARNRTVVPDFDAIVMPGTGHYPMLEQPEAFNELVVRVVSGLDRRTK
ncbi:MAG: alpha/beta hydrolase [Acidobacteriota bacterium]